MTILNKILEKYLRLPFEITKGSQQGWTSTVFQVRDVEGEYILKVCEEPKYKEWLRKEANILEMAQDSYKNVVPQFIGFFEDKERAYLLMSKIPGINLTQAIILAENDEEKFQLIESFGTFLCQLHKQPIANQKIQKEWLDSQLQQAKIYAENGLCDGSLELLEKLNNNRPKLVKQVRIHGDCTTDNVMVYNDKVIAFIDVAFMTIGDPRYDEALAIRKFTEQEKEAFYKGYTRNKIQDKEFTYFNNGLYEFF
ncbi:aminoglycoside phosphotransferase family protein [Rummeliibacillus pycnus]|uniref:aminoglycoside phosphotransferase family protein n=1 Tax=Rummeliibacillus pycnus TaxID=101070 RepID=UPI003D2C965E